MPNYTIGSGLPSIPSGLTDKDASLVTPLYMAVSRLAQNMSGITGNISYSQDELAIINQTGQLIVGRQNIIVFKALVAIAYGQLISLTVDAGKIAAVLADHAVPTAPAHGVCDMPGGVAIGEYGQAIFMNGLTTGIAGSTVGACYWLSTAGTIQASAPGTGRAQRIGVGLGTAGVYLTIDPSN